MWQHGCMNGKGIFTYPNGNKYDGDFVSNLKEGYGTLFYANGEKYEVITQLICADVLLAYMLISIT